MVWVCGGEVIPGALDLDVKAVLRLAEVLGTVLQPEIHLT